MTCFSLLIAALAPAALAFQPVAFPQRQATDLNADLSRRDWLVGTVAAASAGLVVGLNPPPAQAIGPVKINLLNPEYTAVLCPKDRPVPGEKAMKGMKGLCVTVTVDLENSTEKTLEKAGIYGYIKDASTGESVLANNPDLSTDAGQFAMVPEVNPSDKKIVFEFIAAVPKETVSERKRPHRLHTRRMNESSSSKFEKENKRHVCAGFFGPANQSNLAHSCFIYIVLGYQSI
jgi:hypothetical protein